ncbi:MAG: dTDP-4-dehydrorhamnose 3,5-epimerase [Flavobacteriales bacterium]|nr:dTDP-4-dehydrorhamnose 3,5-epimerase [Flavobacteriales bacterium]
MGSFKKIDTKIEGLVVIEPTVHGDARGFFMETYSKKDFEGLGIKTEFVQDNHSKSRRGVLRGLHFQCTHTQGKLIRVVNGAVLDVAVDLRPESPTFGQWESVVLSAENKRQFYVPERFAHGFLTLENDTEFVYKCTDYYCPEGDGGVLWCDPHIGIDWQLDSLGMKKEELLLSEKDQKQPTLVQINWNENWK